MKHTFKLAILLALMSTTLLAQAESRLDVATKRFEQLFNDAKTEQEKVALINEIKQIELNIQQVALQHLSSEQEQEKFVRETEEISKRYDDSQIRQLCLALTKLQMRNVNVPNTPSAMALFEFLEAQAEESCVNYIIKSKIATMLRYPNDYPVGKTLTLPSQKDFAFLKSVTQKGNQIIWQFNDFIPELSGLTLITNFQIEQIDRENKVTYLPTENKHFPKKWLLISLQSAK